MRANSNVGGWFVGVSQVRVTSSQVTRQMSHTLATSVGGRHAAAAAAAAAAVAPKP